MKLVAAPSIYLALLAAGGVHTMPVRIIPYVLGAPPRDPNVRNPGFGAPGRNGTVDYGRATLRRFNFFPTYFPIEPGTFITPTAMAFQMRPVGEREDSYQAVALDRPVLFSDNIMHPADLGWNDPQTARSGRMGHCHELSEFRIRLGHPKADRCIDMAVAMQRLLDRFFFAPDHPQTGLLAKSNDAVPRIITTIIPGIESEVENVPEHAHKIYSARGWVYLSHRRLKNPPAPFNKDLGAAGSLTLAGQVICLWAVLKDRLAELACKPPKDATIKTLRSLVGRTTSPLDWGDQERRDMEEVQGELRQWATVVLTTDEGDPFRPASYFAKVVRPRLRRASLKSRKSRRVRSRMVDGDKQYSLLDAHRNWPDDVPLP